MNSQPSPQAQAYSLRQQAQWHREESQNFLRHSVPAMYQHERAADALEAQADKLEQPA